jgi:hypothetical protein
MRKIQRVLEFIYLAKRILDSIIIKIIHSETDHVVSQHNVRRPSGKHSTTITQSKFVPNIR